MKTKMMMRWEDLEVWETWAVTIKINPALTGGMSLSNAVLSFSLVAPLLMRGICCFCEDRAKRNEKLEADLSDIILQIVREANERKTTSLPSRPPTQHQTQLRRSLLRSV